MTVGEVLAEARSAAGLSVAEVAKRTRIRESVIVGLEQGEFHDLGGDLYVRGYLRAIAGAIGIDPQPLIREFDQERAAEWDAVPDVLPPDPDDWAAQASLAWAPGAAPGPEDNPGWKAPAAAASSGLTAAPGEPPTAPESAPGQAAPPLVAASKPEASPATKPELGAAKPGASSAAAAQAGAANGTVAQSPADGGAAGSAPQLPVPAAPGSAAASESPVPAAPGPASAPGPAAARESSPGLADTVVDLEPVPAAEPFDAFWPDNVGPVPGPVPITAAAAVITAAADPATATDGHGDATAAGPATTDDPAADGAEATDGGAGATDSADCAADDPWPSAPLTFAEAGIWPPPAAFAEDTAGTLPPAEFAEDTAGTLPPPPPLAAEASALPPPLSSREDWTMPFDAVPDPTVTPPAPVLGDARPAHARHTKPPAGKSGTRMALLTAVAIVVVGVLGLASAQIAGLLSSSSSTKAAHTQQATAGKGGGLPAGPPPVSTPAASVPPSQATPTPSQATPTTAPQEPVQFLPVQAADAFGPGGLGDGDNPDRAADAIDADATVPWHTDWYSSADFGDLKSGTGLLLDLGAPKTVTSVKLLLGSIPGASVQIRVGDSPHLADLTTVASVTDAAGSQTLLVPTPTRARYVVVWFTMLPPDGDGKFQALVYHASVLGRP